MNVARNFLRLYGFNPRQPILIKSWNKFGLPACIVMSVADMPIPAWLPWPVLPKRRWPVLCYKEKRAITREEHEIIVSRETNAEMRAFLWCCWHLGGSQSDVAHLKAEDIDWQNQVVSFFRSKTGS